MLRPAIVTLALVSGCAASEPPEVIVHLPAGAASCEAGLAWSIDITGEGPGGTANAVAVAPATDGDLWVAGTVTGVTLIQQHPIRAAAGSGPVDPFVARVTAAGEVLFVRTLGAGDNEWLYDLAPHPAGGAVITGSFAVPLTLGSKTLTSRGGVDVFVARLNDQGEPVWAGAWGSTGYDVGTSVAVAPSGDVLVLGQVAGVSPLGAGNLGGAGKSDVFLARLTPEGRLVHALSVGGAGDDLARDVAAAPDGSAVILGAFSAPLRAGGLTATPAGGEDLFLLQGDAAGAPVRLLGLGGAADERGRALALAPDGGPVIAGAYSAQTELLGVPLPARGGGDVFVLRMTPTWEPLWLHTLGSAGSDEALAIAVGPGDQVTVAGTFSGALYGGPPDMVSGSAADAFVEGLDSRGEPTWGATLGGAGDDAAHRVVLVDGSAVVAGSRGGEAFVWRLPACAAPVAVPDPTAIELLDVGAVR